MFGRFTRQYWKKNSAYKRRSPFGGTVKSMDEVRELNQKILEHERKEAQVAEQMLDSEWEKVEKKQKS